MSSAETTRVYSSVASDVYERKIIVCIESGCRSFADDDDLHIIPMLHLSLVPDLLANPA